MQDQMNPFDFLNSINQHKRDLLEEDPANEKEYAPFLVNRGLSYFHDTVMFANEMNVHHDLDKKLQYQFYLNIVRPRKRFSKWHKKENDSDVEAVKEYYGYSDPLALQALSILTKDQLAEIRKKLEKGG